MHRDLKPENFLFVSGDEEAALKTIDFGLSVFFKPGKGIGSEHLSTRVSNNIILIGESLKSLMQMV